MSDAVGVFPKNLTSFYLGKSSLHITLGTLRTRDKYERSRAMDIQNLVETNLEESAADIGATQLSPGGSKKIRPAVPWTIRLPVLMISAWEVAKTPWEIGNDHDTAVIAALLVGKLLILSSAVAALLRIRLCMDIFTFICAASVLAIAPALPVEIQVSTVLFVLTLAECFLKGTLVILCFAMRFAEDSPI